ncbi:iron-hydroxamate ABC transporter substrate-binding protein [Halalkalibacillus halophilus]|uniref:iron-hydroxamate ABC transporter substrate-binding protein n=1 Tax=Halalkalibacillus halophilus TaxID=392827 RepID=UPI0004280800|nr:iron-hydroxamate ABC transporter substrate-binding protein [Halalkalibacillus halophilus]
MKKLLILAILTLLLIISACGDQDDAEGNTDDTNEEEQTEENTDEEENEEEGNEEDASSDGTITYESANGDVEVPANPERVVVLSTFVGNLLSLDVNIVGADSWSMMNPRFDEGLADAEEVSDESLEKILELEPDLIVGLDNINNKDKLEEIAPTVTFEYGSLDHIEQHIEIGKLVNKEDEAVEWTENFQAKAAETGEQIKEEIGEDATVSIIESFDKQLYVYGDNWGRGGEILYKEMDLPMPERVEEEALEPGYFAISTEVLSDFVGDYVVVSTDTDGPASFQETETFQNLDAVQNDRVMEVDLYEFYFNDAMTLDYQLEFFTEQFLEE